MISVNTFDVLDRLDKLTQYLPDATPNDLSDNTVLAEYDYTLAADGTRIGLTERILKESGAGYDVNVFTWTYDNLNRLLSETLVSSIADFSYEANYVYSLSNNRVSYSVDHADNSKDQSVTYLYDANDRLVTETKFASANFTGEAIDTTYTYSTAGEMIGKTVDVDPSQSETFTFNLQGRLASHTKAGVTTLFRYDTSGIRVASAEYSTTDTLPASSAAWGTGASKIVAYLIDDQNHTGYAQVLEERKVPPGDVAALAAVTKAYVLGMDVLQQFTPADVANGLPTSDNLILLPDGHGSTRLLLASAAGILAGSGLMVPGQRFFYDAYGNLLAPVGAPTPLTTLLYTGEQRDSATGMYYLRARYYNPSMGRFASMDPWSGRYGSMKDYNGYAYVAGNPVNAVDPSGNFFEGLLGILSSSGLRLAMRSLNLAKRVLPAWNFIQVVLTKSIIWVFQNQLRIELYATVAGLSVGAAFGIADSVVQEIDERLDRFASNTRVITSRGLDGDDERLFGANSTQYEALDHVMESGSGKKVRVSLMSKGGDP